MITNMELVESAPLNMAGMNIPQCYGGMVKSQYWESIADQKFFDKRKMISKRGLGVKGWDISDITETSSCEDENRFKQRYDDDKMELLGASDPLSFAFFKMQQFG